MVDAPDPQGGKHGKPPKRHWEAESKAKPHWGEIATLIILAVVGAFQIGIYFKQASIMQTQADIAQQQVKLTEADQRPWISLDMAAEGPLLRDTYGRNFNVRYTLNNVGKSPGFNVDFIAVLMSLGKVQKTQPPPPGFSYGEPSKDAMDVIVKNTCDGLNLLPGSGRHHVSKRPTNQEMETARRHQKKGFIPGFLIIGCVVYQFADDAMRHHTARIYELSALADRANDMNLSPDSIPTADLAFFPHYPRAAPQTSTTLAYY